MDAWKQLMDRIDAEWWPCGIKDTAEEAQELIAVIVRVDERERAEREQGASL